MTGVAPTVPGAYVDRAGLDEPARLRLAGELREAVRGEVCFDRATRAIYATDSSNYRQVPLGVVFPRDETDVLAALRVCAGHDAPVLGRGGGTSLAGQACNVAVVLDCSRHMTRIVEVDPRRRLARVEPGVVLDDLRAAAEQHGLTFGPDPATHAWCTLGGMVGNNSCGTHALYAGKTVDNVERVVAVTYDGERLNLGACDDREYARVAAAGGAPARVHGGLREIARRYGDLVRERYPDIPRRVSGYNLDQLLPENGFHLARALVGTESTCAVVTEVTVRLIHSPAVRRMVVLGFSDVYVAADHVPALLEHPLLGLEGFDRTLVDQMRAIDLNVDGLALLPPGGGWLIAELGADDPATADALADAFVAALPADVERRRYADPHDQRRVWSVRESALGATAHPPGARPNHEGWEDAAVAPEHLGAYLRGIAALWEEYGYTGAWYGHFGQGCVHTRNPFDLHTAAGLRAYRSFVGRAADLCLSLGGSLSGEHGDGQARGELLERMYGAELVDAFRQFKAVWDPRGRMNPGKVVDAFPLDTNLRYGPAYTASTLHPTHFAFERDAGSLQKAAERCVGVGRCRRSDTGVMCPSYRATLDEKHSTRGRAKMLVEMFQGEVTPERWRNDDVREALDLCLSCKGCVVDCPTHVDMATYKAEFLSHYYAGRLRPRAAYALGLVAWAARTGTAVPDVANAVLRTPVLGELVKLAGGVSRRRPAPAFAAVSFRRSRGTRARRRTADPTVVFWPDTFTDAFAPRDAVATVRVLEDAGERVVVPSQWACCGRPLYDFGMLDVARRTLLHALDLLEPWLADGLPVVVAEPSCLAVFRDELPALLRADPRAARLAGLARSLAEHLVATGWQPPVRRRGRAVVHPHCHQRAAVGTAADREVLERLGYQVEILDAGCCGLAGSFGFRAEHDELSRTVATQTWLPRIHRAAAGADALVIDGFSCATQAAHLGGPGSTSLARLLYPPRMSEPDR